MADLRKALKICSGFHTEVIMKDNQTIGNNPWNVVIWCKIAREEVRGFRGSIYGHMT